MNKLISRRLNGDDLENKVRQKHFHRAERLPHGLFCYSSSREGRRWESERGSPLEMWTRPCVSMLPLLCCLLLFLPHPCGRHTARATSGGQMWKRYPGQKCAYGAHPFFEMLLLWIAIIPAEYYIFCKMRTNRRICSPNDTTRSPDLL